MIVIDFLPEHIAQFANYGGQEKMVETYRPEDLLELKARSFGAITIIKDNAPIGCGGVAAITPYRGLVWAIFARTSSPKDFLFMHRASAGFLAASQFRRIEAFVDPEFKPAMRWIKMLGFELERFVPYFFKDGSIASQWAMHK